MTENHVVQSADALVGVIKSSDHYDDVYVAEYDNDATGIDDGIDVDDTFVDDMDDFLID